MTASQLTTLDIVGPLDLNMTDQEIGEWLVATWLGIQAEKRGIPLQKIPPEFARELVASTAKIDTDSVNDAALQSIFRKAHSGEYETAGRMLRKYILSRADSAVKAKYAPIGLARVRDRRNAGKATAAKKKKEAAEWHPKAIKHARSLVNTGRKPSETTAIVARQLGMSPRSVRPILQAAGIVKKKETR